MIIEFTSIMFAPEDHARIIDPECSLVPVKSEIPLPLDERVAALCALADNGDACDRLRSIGLWLHGLGGVETMRGAAFDAFKITDATTFARETFGRSLHRAWAGVGDWS